MSERSKSHKSYKNKRGGKNQSPRAGRNTAAAPSAQSPIFGIHAALAALKNPDRQIIKIMATKNGAHRVTEALDQPNLQIEIVAPEKIEAALPRDSVHQGILVFAKPLREMAIADIVGQGPVIVLDQVTDPHNVGAIMRTACAFGVAGVIVTNRNAPFPTGVLAKAASGAVEHLPLVRVVNLARAIDELNEAGFQTIGLTDATDKSLVEVTDKDERPRPIALVLGAEGRGIRTLTAKTCTDLARIDLPGPIDVLNVSNAAAVALTLVAYSA
ncbi:MAG: 23S rRNA (guanosine(2251)-2'-O)-methyltransferase RlmB [Rhizobiales bacterium]|nr:23S rRNA (guanosine(2251)-2'-O)-methyltransferase RlmB [Hyphomicrobiales bacterium]